MTGERPPWWRPNKRARYDSERIRERDSQPARPGTIEYAVNNAWQRQAERLADDNGVSALIAGKLPNNLPMSVAVRLLAVEIERLKARVQELEGESK